MDRYSKWLNNLKSVWENKDIKLLGDIIADNTEYFETPYGTPHTTGIEVIEQWENDLENQSDIYFDFNILIENKDSCIANWNAEFKRDGDVLKMDGIFHFKLDKDNKCVYFKQWWVIKP